MIQVSARRLAALIVTTLLAAGCASQSSKPDAAPGKSNSGAAEKIVNKRSIERWEFLIAHKADVNRRNSHNETALSLAKRDHKTEIMRLLTDAGGTD